MRIRPAHLAVLILAFASPAGAEDVATASPGASAQAIPQSKLDSLFSDLKRERNEKAAERIAGRIWEEWGRSGSASIDLMMEWSKTAMDGQKFDVALDFLDQVVTMRPTYAEGWNRRATVHFLMNNFGGNPEKWRQQGTCARRLAARARRLSDDARRADRSRHHLRGTRRRSDLTEIPRPAVYFRTVDYRTWRCQLPRQLFSRCRCSR
jgi:hypothetical protein